MTSEFGATLSMMNTLPPMVLPAPMTVSPPRMVAPGIDRHAILDGRMPFLAAQLLSAGRGFRPQRHAVIHLHVIADDRGFAHDRAGAMIHEEVRADLRAGMQVHAGARVRPLAHDARNERHIFADRVRCASRCTAMASMNGYATMISSLLNAAGSPLKAASVSV